MVNKFELDVRYVWYGYMDIAADEYKPMDLQEYVVYSGAASESKIFMRKFGTFLLFLSLFGQY